LSHSLNDGSFAITLAVGLPSLTAVSPCFHSLACAAQFEYDLALVVLSDRAHQLPNENPCRVCRHQVWLGNGDQRESVLLEIANRGLLDQQVAR
jgi:hypothetical protein